MPTKDESDVKPWTHAAVIATAIKLLPDGARRLSIEKFRLGKQSILRCFQPDFVETLLSDRGQAEGDENMQQDYLREINTIYEVLEASKIPIGLADWQKGPDMPAAEEMHRNHNRRAYAMSLWDEYAIRWRFKGGYLHVICPPEDILGKPIVYRYTIPEFLDILVRARQKELEQQEQHEKERRWTTILIIVGVLVGIAFIMLLK